MIKLFPGRRCVIALLAVLGSFTVVSAGHSWNDFHWARTHNPFTLKLGVNTPSWWHPYVIKTSVDWNQSEVLETEIVAGSTTSLACSPTSGRVEVCVDYYGTTGWLGIAQVWLSGSHIVQGTVKVNETYFHTPQYNSSAWRHLVMCQEVGHTLGLDHQDEAFANVNLGTCMDYTNDPDGSANGQLSNVSPNAHDYDQLSLIYAHLDGTTTVGNTTAARNLPPAMRQIAFATRAQWGKLIRTTDNGRTGVFELDFGGGFRVHTFVVFS